MPIYTCTIAESILSADTTRALAGEIARISSSISHVPSTYVNVAFHELSADALLDPRPYDQGSVSGQAEGLGGVGADCVPRARVSWPNRRP